MQTKPHPMFNGMTYVGEYRGVHYYTDNGRVYCLMDKKPRSFPTIRMFKTAVTKWKGID